MAQKPPLQQGIEIVQRAIECDNQHKYTEAIALYDQSVMYLLEAIKLETNPGTEAAIQSKIKEYQSRSATLKSAVQQPSAAPVGIQQSPNAMTQTMSFAGPGQPAAPPLLQSGSAYGRMNPGLQPQPSGYGAAPMYNLPPYGNGVPPPSASAYPPSMAMGYASPYGGPYGQYPQYYMGNPGYTAAGISLSNAGPFTSPNSPSPYFPYGAQTPYGGGGAMNAYPQPQPQPPFTGPPPSYANSSVAMGLPNNVANTLSSRPAQMIDSSGRGGTGKRLMQEKSHSSWNPLRPGSLHLRAEIQSDIVKLGETVRIHILVTNPSSQKIDCLKVKLTRSDYRLIVGHTGKIPKERIAEKEYVQGNRFPMREGTYEGDLLFPIPTNISPSTGGNFEYYLSVSCYLGHTSKDLNVRFPIKIVSSY